MATKSAELSISKARSILKEAGLRCTASRVAVLRHLADSDQPMSHTDVAERLEAAGYDRSTIYRCLMDLAEAGILTRMDLGDHTWRFGLLRDHDRGEPDHPHFLCVGCGQAVCLPGVEVRITGATNEEPPSVGDVTEVVLKGHCVKCR
jgi:Fur family ferric uptake transcriptional regulator